MVMWEGYHSDNKVPVIITVEYDTESELYVVEVVRGLEFDFKTFTPKYKPENELMHISDVEKSVQLANVLVKELKQLANRRKK